jgi:hypothetical protein
MTAHRMLVIPVEGPVRVVSEVGGLRLAHLQAVVGGYIEAVHVSRILTDTGLKRAVCTVFVNEEGKLHSLPFNPRATDLCAVSIAPPPADYIAGDVAVLGPADAEGGETDVPLVVLSIVQEWRWMGRDVTP